MRTLLLVICGVGAWAQGVVGPPFFVADLRPYLKLTEAQEREIAENYARYQASQTGTRGRIARLNREIWEETQRRTPDVGNLGVRYQEIESLCRQQETPRKETYERQMRVLNEEQKRLLAPLGENEQLLRLATMAERTFLLARRNLIPLTGLGGFLIAPALPGIQDVPAELAVYLGMTGVQLEQLRAALREQEQFVAAREGRMAEVRRELEGEFAADAPSAMELGLRYWELEAQRRQMAEREEETRRVVSGILTAVQRGRLGALEQARELAGAAGAAAALQLLPVSGPNRPASVPVENTPLFGAATASELYRSCRGDAGNGLRSGDFSFSVP